MNLILGFIGKIFGMGSGASLINNAGGAVNHLAMITAITYLCDHINETITFTASYGFLAVVVAFAYMILELFRRSTPGAA